MAGAEVKRASRVAEGIREELSVVLAQEARDPRLAMVVISRVELTDDLRSARVYVRLLDGGDDEARRNDLLTGLARAQGMLRREVTQRLSLRYAPELRFFYDEGQDRAARVHELLAEVERERRGRE
jgi:ribosome-binding factor A